MARMLIQAAQSQHLHPDRKLLQLRQNCSSYDSGGKKTKTHRFPSAPLVIDLFSLSQSKEVAWPAGLAQSIALRVDGSGWLSLQ